MATWGAVFVLGVIGAALFFVPNHGQKPSGERPSLARSLAGLFGQPPPRWELWSLLIFLGWVFGSVSVFLPAAVLAWAVLAGAGKARVAFGVGGVAIILGGLAAMFVMAISVASFMWGGGTLAKPNVMVKVILVFFGACGVASLVLAAWGSAAAWVVGG